MAVCQEHKLQYTVTQSRVRPLGLPDTSMTRHEQDGGMWQVYSVTGHKRQMGLSVSLSETQERSHGSENVTRVSANTEASREWV